MANPRDTEVFAIERCGLPEDFVYYRALGGVHNRRHSESRICFKSCDCLRPTTVARTGRDSVFQTNLLCIFYPSPRGRFHYAHRPKRLSVRRWRSQTTAEGVVCGLDMDQSLSQPTKCTQLTLHNAPKLTKLQAVSYAGVR